MLKDLTSIYLFIAKYKYRFTIRNATNRPIYDPNIFNSYSVDNLINTNSFKDNKFYVEYSTISNAIDNLNVYDFYKHKVCGNLWKNRNFLTLEDVLHSINNCEKEYVIIGGSFWYYSNLYDMQILSNVFKTLIPSDKILDELNKNNINMPFNCIHYRYENDWNCNLKMNNIPYIVPPIDELINNIPFKEIYPIYICTSNIHELQSRKLLYNDLDKYYNILYKNNNNLNFDENGFLDLLILTKSKEFYGNSISGFSVLANTIKNSNNYYNKIKYFDKFDVLV